MPIDLVKINSMLCEPIEPVGNYVFVKQVGDLLFTSGIIPLRNGALIHKGKLGSDITIEQGRECAKQCVLNVLSLLKGWDEDGFINCEVVSARVFIASAAEFTDQAKVANGASDFLVELFGDAGRHTRAVIGAISLPLDAPVEIEFVFKVVR